ncbi:hypothetical protein BT63DRAFT_449440 [Microthyrium microscopicum]|uniref:Uncharacterized protein n=1 Tax=Microthyrium microscopicum TaxID=703497 RepID=A0A6A6UQ80_9PEZI|nr:hypothetical protein BT63DRAFT_449440 [Microthyrium microscopicum]
MGCGGSKETSRATPSAHSKTFDLPYGIEYIEMLVQALDKSNIICCVVGPGAMRYHGIRSRFDHWQLVVRHIDLATAKRIRTETYREFVKNMRPERIRLVNHSQLKQHEKMMELCQGTQLISTAAPGARVLDLDEAGYAHCEVSPERGIPYPKKVILEANPALCGMSGV